MATLRLKCRGLVAQFVSQLDPSPWCREGCQTGCLISTCTLFRLGFSRAREITCCWASNPCGVRVSMAWTRGNQNLALVYELPITLTPNGLPPFQFVLRMPFKFTYQTRVHLFRVWDKQVRVSVSLVLGGHP